MAKHTKNKPTGNYPVGYAQPPKASQFKPGQSGNPTGRKSRPKTLQDYQEKLLRKAYKVMGSEGPQTVSGHELIAMMIMQRATKGDFRAIKYLVEFISANPGGLEETIRNLELLVQDLQIQLEESRKKEHTGAVIAIPQFSMTMEEWYAKAKEAKSAPEIDLAVLRGEKKLKTPD